VRQQHPAVDVSPERLPHLGHPGTREHGQRDAAVGETPGQCGSAVANRPENRASRPGLWSYITGRRGVSRVRAYERYRGSPLKMEWYAAGKRVQASLQSVAGHRVGDRAKAIEIADSFAERLAASSGSTKATETLIHAGRRAKERPPVGITQSVADRAALPSRTLLAHKLPVEPICGIYFLMGARDTVRYVGQSRDIMSRLAQHRKSPPVPFTRVAWQPFALHELDEAEARLIARFEPVGNRSRPSMAHYPSDDSTESTDPACTEREAGGAQSSPSLELSPAPSRRRS
jgi:hypothetical protein